MITCQAKDTVNLHGSLLDVDKPLNIRENKKHWKRDLRQKGSIIKTRVNGRGKLQTANAFVNTTSDFFFFWWGGCGAGRRAVDGITLHELPCDIKLTLHDGQKVSSSSNSVAKCESSSEIPRKMKDFFKIYI